MSYSDPVDNTQSASYSGYISTDLDPNWPVTISFTYDTGYPFNSLTEAQTEEAFQDFVDYIAAYAHSTGVTAGKSWTGGQNVTPTEDPA